MPVIASARETRFLKFDPDNHVFLIDRAAYASPAVFEEEKRKVLYRTWIILGHDAEIAKPGDYVARRVIDKDLIFNRDQSGQVNVFFNTCMHRGTAVTKETCGNARTFVCPYHGWVYRDSGQLISAGNREADACYPMHYFKGGKDGISLQRIKNVAQRAGFWFVNFDDDAPPLDDYLAGAGLRLDRIAHQTAAGFEMMAGVHEYEIKANYKLLCENSYDGYHLRSVHSSYLEYMAAMFRESKMDPKLYGVQMSLGNGHGCFESPVMSGKPVAQWLPHWGEAARQLVEEKRREVISRVGAELGANVCDFSSNLVIFPNSIINDQQTVLARSIIPIAHNRMRVRAWSIAPKDEHPTLRKIRVENLLSFLGPGGFATPDDVSMLEWAQSAYESTDVRWNDFSKGMQPGQDTMNCTDDMANETQIRAYWLKWDEMMSDSAD